MKYQVSAIRGPVNQEQVKNKLEEFLRWLHLESGASPTKKDPLVISVWDERTQNTALPTETQ